MRVKFLLMAIVALVMCAGQEPSNQPARDPDISALVALTHRSGWPHIGSPPPKDTEQDRLKAWHSRIFGQ